MNQSSSSCHHNEHPHAGHRHEDHSHAGGHAADGVPHEIEPADLPIGSGGLLLRIPAMDCAAEESQIRAALDHQTGIRSLRFHLGSRTLRIDALPQAWESIEQSIEALGMKTERLSQEVSQSDRSRAQRLELLKLGTALLLALGAELLHFFPESTMRLEIVSMGLAGMAIALSGIGVYRKGLASLLRGRLGITALMTVAVTGAFVIGQWAEAAMVMALYALAELIEARAVDRARHAIKGLLDLAPAATQVRQPDGTWHAQEAATVKPGQVVRVNPGERLALDGRILTGHSAIDQASITGESVPVEKGPGDEVFAGTVNHQGALEYEVTAPASDTVLARIIHAVEEAQGTRAPTQRFVDRFAAIYTPAVFVIALAVAILGPLLTNWTWVDGLYRSLVLLVIACPCALVISTPVTVVSGLAAAARRGILIKGGAYLEEARKLSHLAMDKTGTLTVGRPRLVAHEVIRPGVPAAEVKRLAASLASRSDHPVSKAIAGGLLASAPSAALDVVDAFAAEPGRGSRGTLAGRPLVLGNHRWMQERGQMSALLEQKLRVHEQHGRTVTLLADEQGVLALFAVADTLKPSAQAAVQELKELGLSILLLTGDNPVTARAVANEAGIEEVRAGLLPQEKLEAIMALTYPPRPESQVAAQSAGRQIVGMVGDGINDAPALAAADIAVAMGHAGTHIATEAADVVLMNDDLRRLPELVRLSRRVHRILWQNITLALGIKAIFLWMALAGTATMWMAVFADMGASLLVVGNGLRLLKAPGRKPKERESPRSPE